MWRWEMPNKFWSENLSRRAHLHDLGIDERIILSGILQKEFKRRDGLDSLGSA
jgi:hypothetical protein